MREKTILLATEWSTPPPAADDLVALLERASLSADLRQPGLYRLRSPTGRVVYVEEQPHGASGRLSWVVHADAFGGQAPRQIPCATIARVLIAIRAALAGTSVPSVVGG